MTNASIARESQEAWARDPLLDGEPLSVSVAGGQATLKGQARTRSEIARAQNDASEVRGVLSVENEVAVSSGTTAATDQVFLKNVESRLDWNPFVDSQNIHISVRNGVVKLEGTIGSSYESGAAELSAEKAGARRVENLLFVLTLPAHAPGTISF